MPVKSRPVEAFDALAKEWADRATNEEIAEQLRYFKTLYSGSIVPLLELAARRLEQGCWLSKR